ncbi:hypothetical protein RI129_005389 [Pyrocoelia pectoralis]|uniref:Aspartate aminotransferase n=1 Tax=Pyrocoelia pectoralis TaxID=417401 RepID=A0AAN7ZHH3_9COLE
MSRFADVALGRPIEAFALTKAFTEDAFPQKINLGVGAYRTDEGKPWVLPVVREVEKLLASGETYNKEYLPVLGLESFTNAATSMLLGHDSPALLNKKAFGVQCLSGTGALRVGAEFLAKQLGSTIFYCSAPSWDLRDAPENSVIILHACWKQIADVIEKKHLFPFLDCAYQGFASGDLEKDSWAVRYFVSRGFELFCAQSFAKNFGLYNERVGNLTVILNDLSYQQSVKSQFTLLIRGIYSTPPLHGASIVSHVLNNPKLFEQWKGHIRTMSSRIITMRKALRTALEKINTPGDWSHITAQIGMFSYTGLNEQQSERMVKKHHIYMLRSGRINMSGMKPGDVEYIAQAIKETLTSVP